MTILQAIVLGLVQGLGEFLPISSSAHLILVPWFFNWPQQSVQFDVALHLGTLAAVTIYFWRDLLDLAVQGLTKGTKTPTGKLAWGIVLGTVPAAVVGLWFEERIEELFRGNYPVIAVLLALMGVILYVVDRRGAKRRSIEDVSLLDVVLMGFGQACALIPGFSRSGTTITTGLLLGFEREAAAKVSFLLGFPVILGAGIFAVKDMAASELNAMFYLGVAVSAVSGYIVIAFLMDYLRKGTYAVFAIYRAALAALTLFLYFLRG